MNIFNHPSRDIPILFFTKIAFVSAIYSAMFFILNEQLFNYYDMADYMHCIPNDNSNITNLFYRQFICALGLNYMGSMSSASAIIIASMMNSFMLITFYMLLAPFLSRRGQIIFILLLAFHPYLAIYFPRLYSDIFGSLGILFITYYALGNKKIDILFIIGAFFLINLRGALIPAFFCYALFVFIQTYSNQKKTSLKSILLMFVVFINFLIYKDFAESFMSFAIFSDQGFLVSVPKESPYFSADYPFFNPILLLGFRESVSNLGFQQLFIAGNIIGIIYLITSLTLVGIHFLGIIGLIKFAIVKHRFSLISVLAIILIPLIAISHLRYLLPLIPLLLFGLVWMFFPKLEDLRSQKN
jgi:hypothetical protein